MFRILPGLGQAAITDDQVLQIRRIVATHMASDVYPTINPLKGVKFTRFPPGFNLQPEAEVSFSVYGHAARLATGPQRVKAIADEIKEILGYAVFVWAEMEGHNFDANSEEDLPDS